MTFYCGIDLHTKKSHVCIVDKDGKKVKEENLNNDLSLILQFLKPFGRDVHIVIEATINCPLNGWVGGTGSWMDFKRKGMMLGLHTAWVSI